MLAYAWKSLGWFAASVAVALGFLLVPLQVAAERKKLDKTTALIAAAHRDIRALETEFDTRANLAQLEQWNGDTLRLTAPVSGQYVSDEAALASLDLRQQQPLPAGAGQPATQMASLVVPSRPTGLATVQAVAPAVRILPRGATPAPNLPTPVGEVRTAAAQRSKAQAVALLDRKLLSDSTMGDLMSSARAETGGAAR